MRIDALCTDEIRLTGDPATMVAGLTADSRKVGPGDLFAALPGTRTDGRRFIADARAKGAAALLGGPDILTEREGLPALVAEDPRRAFALCAARMAGAQPTTVVAVTGTNGKTSTAVFVRQLWTALGRRAASLGTLGLEAPGRNEPGSLTTPDPVALHRLAADLARDGVDHLVLEASSHGLDQRRLDGLRMSAAAFTNLSRDHLDYHGSLEAYLAAKLRLFDTLLPDGGTAVVNADVPEAGPLRDIASRRRLSVIDYGHTASRLRLVAQRPLAHGQELDLVVDGAAFHVTSPLVGDFQACNLLAALGLVLATGASAAEVLPHLGSVQAPPGRMELAARTATGAAAYVDYAHTPDALEKALAALRPHTEGRLHVVFGCGGDRDRGKRPVMGSIAVRLADHAIVTDDNPRTEVPAAIRAEILAAAPGAVEIGDRATAIATAFRALQPGDVLLVAGKGHERGQIVGDRVLPFDDAAVLRDVAVGGLAA